MKSLHTDKLKQITAMAIFGTIGVARKYIPYPSGLVALIRGVVGTLFLLLVNLIQKKKFSMEKSPRNIILLILSGALVGLNWICLFEAYRFTTVSVATVCYYMAPVFVILASPFVFKEKFTLKKSICSIAAIIGMIMVSGIIETGFSVNKGVLLGLIAALMYATVIILNKFITGISANERTIMQLGFAAITILPYVLLTEDLSNLDTSPTVLIMLAVVGIVHTGVAYALYFGSIKNLPAQTVALFSYIDPIIAVVLSFTLLGEAFSITSAVGVILVIGATVICELTGNSKQD